MSYKVGDKFVIEIEETICGYGNNPNDTGHITEPLHRIKGFNALVFNSYGLDKLQKYDKYAENLEKNHEVLKIFEEKYNQGLQDAWELAKKLFADMSDSDLNEIFGKDWNYPKLMRLTPQQAFAKIEAYEESKAIKVGDVVYADDEPDSFGVVTWVNERMIYVMWDDGSSGMEDDISDYHKTGRHIDIEHLLEQIRGNE